MSADFLVQYLRIPAGEHKVDLEATLAVYDKCDIDDFSFIDDLQDVFDSLDTTSDDDSAIKNIDAVIKSDYRDILISLVDAINNPPQDTCRIPVGNNKQLILTGGMSYGTSPTETFDLLSAADCLPAAVLDALGVG